MFFSYWPTATLFALLFSNKRGNQNPCDTGFATWHPPQFLTPLHSPRHLFLIFNTRGSYGDRRYRGTELLARSSSAAFFPNPLRISVNLVKRWDFDLQIVLLCLNFHCLLSSIRIYVKICRIEVLNCDDCLCCWL